MTMPGKLRRVKLKREGTVAMCGHRMVAMKWVAHNNAVNNSLR
jgi:hypothetical protein